MKKNNILKITGSQIAELKFFTAYIVAVLFLLTIIWIIPTKQTHKQVFSEPFLETNPAWADTTLKYITPDEKIRQLIIQVAGSKTPKILSDTTSQYTLGGIIYRTDSLKHQIDVRNHLNEKSKIAPFEISNSLLLQNSYAELAPFPGINHLSAIRRDTLFFDYIKYIASINYAMGTSAVIIPGPETSSDDSIFENNILDFYIKLCAGYKQTGLLTGLSPDILFKDDSAHFDFNNRLLSQSSLLINPENNKTARKKYNFGGLIVHSVNNDSIQLIKEHFLTGTDLFISHKPKKTIQIIKHFLSNGELSETQLNQKVRRILLAKTYLGLNKKRAVDYDSVLSIINSKQNQVLRGRVYKNSLCLLKNDEKLLPFKDIQRAKFLIINLSSKKLPVLSKTLKNYSKQIIWKTSEKHVQSDFQTRTILLTDNTTKRQTLKKIQNQLKTTDVLINFGPASDIRYADSLKSIIQAFGASPSEQKYIAESLFGGIALNGKYRFPHSNFSGKKQLTTKKTRVAECLPEEVNIDGNKLAFIDSIAKSGISLRAYPGCQIVVLKNGYDIYNKSFGYQSYARRRKVSKSDVYDLASVTKVAATTTAMMKMYDKGKIRLDDKLGKFFRDTKIDYSNIKPDTLINIDTLIIAEIKDFNRLLQHQDTLHLNDSLLIAYDTIFITATPKNNIFKVKIQDLLLHKSGITPVLPILPYLMYKKFIYDSLEVIEKRYKAKNIPNSFNSDTSLSHSLPKFNIKDSIKNLYAEYYSPHFIKDTAECRIAENFYFKSNYFDTLWKNTKRLPVYSRKIYQYSDINMILLQQVIDSVNNRNMNDYLRQNIYLPMGLNSMGFKPYKSGNKNRIVPTENDKYWREQLLRGDVHDPSAAMLGGISGNAGLFSNAYDLALLGQMWLNKGTYGGKFYLSSSTIKLFTGPQKDSHRGLGFDKASLRGINAPEAPYSTFGHTGFTGTCIWVDPENEIVFVFLSNRVHPNQKNWRINRYDIRENIHSVIYQAMKAYKD